MSRSQLVFPLAIAASVAAAVPAAADRRVEIVNLKTFVQLALENPATLDSQVDSLITREPDEPDGSWCPQRPGYYVAWSNNLSTYFFGPYDSPGLTFGYLQELNRLTEGLRSRQIGDYQKAHAMPFLIAYKGQCIAPGPFLAGGWQANASQVQEAIAAATFAEVERLSVELAKYYKCLDDSSACAGANVDPERIAREARGAANDLIDLAGGPGGGNGPLDKRIGDALGSAGSGGPGAGSPSGGGSEGGSEGGGVGGAERGIGVLPGDAPLWLQVGTRLALDAMGIPWAETVAVLAYMAMPDVVSDIANVASGFHKALVPKELSDVLDGVADVYHNVGGVIGFMQELQKGNLTAAVKELAKNTNALPAEVRAALASPELAQLLTGEFGKLLDNSEAATQINALLAGRITQEQLEKWVGDTARGAVDSAIRKQFAAEAKRLGLPDPAALDAAIRSGRPGDISGALLEGLKDQPGLAMLSADAVDAFRKGDAEAFQRAVLDGALRQSVLQKLPAGVTPDVLDRIVASLNAGDLAGGWKSATHVALSQLPPRQAAVLADLLEGRPEQARRRALQDAIEGAGLSRGTAQLLAGSNDWPSALYAELRTRTGTDATQWRRIVNAGASEAVTRMLAARLRERAGMAAWADELERSPEKSAEIAARMIGAIQEDLLRAVRRATGSAVATLAEFAGGRGAAAEETLLAVAAKLPVWGVLTAADVKALLRQPPSIVANAALRRAFAGDPLLEAAIARDQSRIDDESQTRLEDALRALRDAAGQPLLRDEDVRALVEGDSRALSRQFIERNATALGFSEESAVEAIAAGNLGAAIEMEIEARRSSPGRRRAEAALSAQLDLRRATGLALALTGRTPRKEPR